MPEETDRPQDVGRRHRATTNAPTPETAAILERYRGAMRAELGDVLDELRPERAQLTIDGGAERIRPALVDRLKLWDLAIKLGRELASPSLAGVEWDTAPFAAAVDKLNAKPKPARAPRLNARERRSLGG